MRKLLQLQIALPFLFFSLLSFSQTIVPVTNCASNGWVREVSNTGQSVGVTNGPGIPPYPVGSAEFSIGPDGSGGAEFTTRLYSGTLLTDITELSYWTYLQIGQQRLAVYLILNIDVNGDGIFDLTNGDDQLMYDPAFQGSFTHQVIQSNVWQQWDALHGGWWSLHGAAGAIDGPNSHPLSSILASYPNTAQLAAGNSIRLATGYSSPAWDNFLGNADGFTIRIGFSPSTIYDFETCQVIADSDGDGVDDAHDCAPLDPHLSAPITYFADLDNDGYGDPKNPISVCSLTPPPGYVTNNGDCDDKNNAVHPGATEVCNGIDDNCDGFIDEGFNPTTFYRDADGDGFGDPFNRILACGNAPQGYVSNNADCNDNNANIHPGATEICNGVDDNCDGSVDEGFTLTTYYKDADNDGYGNPRAPIKLCAGTAPPGYSSNNLDCDDNDPNIHPGAKEIINGKDDNCDGGVDEGGCGTIFYRDADGDGYGDPASSVSACSPPAGYVKDNRDCNDNNPNVHPGAIERCDDGIDNDCDGKIDNGIAPVADAGPDKKVYYAGPGNVYAGYPNCTTLTASGSGGYGPYSYKWSTGASTQSITVCPTVTTTYTVTITGSNGCQSSDQVTVFAVDVRCDNKNDKVMVCHKGLQICVSSDAVQSHLNHGDILGSCPATVTRAIKANENKNLLPLVYSLSNFPNPFGSITNIQYSVPVDSRITLKLYDLMGREIKVLFSGDRRAGHYTIEMNGSKLTTGVYYYRMKAVSILGETEKIEKMIIVR